MTNMNDGGPAYPGLVFAGWHPAKGNEWVPSGGMTLRDWFAGMALIGVALGENTPKSVAMAATWAYEQADAMIAEKMMSEKNQA
jgi:hypothetical protein